ncbi:MAG: FecR domain-containing protein [Bacteroidota bacterium]
MDQLQLLKFLEKLSSGDYTSQEYKVFADWVANTSREEYEKLLITWQDVVEQKESFEPMPASFLKNIESSLDALENKEDGIKALKQDRITTQPLWKKLVAAASIIFVLSAGGYLLIRQPNTPQQITQNNNENDVLPGGNKAYLTLGNGKRISLTDAKNGTIASQADKTIQKSADGMIVYDSSNNGHNSRETIYNTLETPPGGQYQIVLPDGSKVWLNAASSLKYPATFNGTDRQVELTGEAYFQVAKDKLHPFKVITTNQEVTVLGTHFNINAYSNEPATKTTLLEGSVKITTGNKEKTIKPGQQAAFVDGQLKIEDIDTELATAWKNNKFIFDGDRIDYIMRMVERWYNVEVIYNGIISNEKFYGGTSRFANVSEVLKSLEATGKIHFKIEGRKIIVSQ